MKKTTALTALITSYVLLFTACSKSDTATDGGTGGTRTFSCAGITPKFATDVQPILTTVCSINSNCHAGGSSNSGGPFTSYAEVNAKKSNIRAAILAGTMPQSGSISQAQINAFICWIDSGAPNN
ncbi:hypothetical protein [Ferruginibacter sp.]|nr:hypothetical protein [Ferruginibacter sp.]